jgi:hypothetical protein
MFSQEVCVICLDGGECHKMMSVFEYIKECNCNCLVHSNCLYDWHKIANNKCLICQKLVYIKNSNFNTIMSRDVKESQDNLLYFILFGLSYYVFMSISFKELHLLRVIPVLVWMMLLVLNDVNVINNGLIVINVLIVLSMVIILIRSILL